MVKLSKREVLVAPFVAGLGLQAAASVKASAAGVGDSLVSAATGPFNSSVASLETYRIRSAMQNSVSGRIGDRSPLRGRATGMHVFSTCRAIRTTIIT